MLSAANQRICGSLIRIPGEQTIEMCVCVCVCVMKSSFDLIKVPVVDTYRKLLKFVVKDP
eukprot:COSAG05_NODE_12537_length_464_cov_0.693151_2_plen_60_part_00